MSTKTVGRPKGSSANSIDWTLPDLDFDAGMNVKSISEKYNLNSATCYQHYRVHDKRIRKAHKGKKKIVLSIDEALFERYKSLMAYMNSNDIFNTYIEMAIDDAETRKADLTKIDDNTRSMTSEQRNSLLESLLRVSKEKNSVAKVA